MSYFHDKRIKFYVCSKQKQACCEALYDMEGIKKGVCARTVQMDIQIMRSDKLGYYAPIEVYDRIYYRYSDPNYSITKNPLSLDDCNLIKKAIILLRNKENPDMYLETSKQQ